MSAQKKLEKNSKYEKYDISGDGVVSDDELALVKEMSAIERNEEKAESQKKMSWVAVGSMVGFTAGLFTPFVPVDRVAALADLLGLFYLGQAAIVGFYFGAQAYMSRQR